MAKASFSVVDRFSKYAHFIALGHPYTATSVARAFFQNIVRLHGFPTSIVSDRDPVFTGHVWRDLFKQAGVQLRMSTAFHPQTDGQSEAVNKTIAMYLRCITGDRPRKVGLAPLGRILLQHKLPYSSAHYTIPSCLWSPPTTSASLQCQFSPYYNC